MTDGPGDPARRQLPIVEKPAGPGGRAGWHRRVALLPLGYLTALAVLACLHPFLPAWRWLGIHLLLLGAVTNAILVWSAHFSAAILRIPVPPRRRAEAARLGLLNAGVIGVLAGGAADRPWVGVGGAVLVFGAIAAHLWWLAAEVRRALPARFAVTVHYYLAAAGALLTGIPAGAVMLVAAGPRLLLFHSHVNLLGWVVLTVLGTLLTFWPTVLRTRMDDGAVAAARTGLPVAVGGLLLVGLGALLWWPAVAVAGLAAFAAAVVVTAVPAVRAARSRPPASFASWSIAAGGGWLLVALGLDAYAVGTATTPDAAADRFGGVLVALLIGAVAQILLGSLAYLLPMVLGGGPAVVRDRTERLDRHGAQRVTMANLALVVLQWPGAGSWTRVTTSLLVLAALVQFLIPAARVLISARR